MKDLSLADRIRDARNLKGLTQRQLADVLGVAERTVRNWELGSTVPRSKIPHLERVLEIELVGPKQPGDLRVEEIRGDDETLRLFYAKHGASSSSEMRLTLTAALMDLARREAEASTSRPEGQQADLEPGVATSLTGDEEPVVTQFRQLRGRPRTPR